MARRLSRLSLLARFGVLSVVTLAMTFGADAFYDLTSRAAHQLLNRDEYVRAVLGGTP